MAFVRGGLLCIALQTAPLVDASFAIVCPIEIHPPCGTSVILRDNDADAGADSGTCRCCHFGFDTRALHSGGFHFRRPPQAARCCCCCSTTSTPQHCGESSVSVSVECLRPAAQPVAAGDGGTAEEPGPYSPRFCVITRGMTSRRVSVATWSCSETDCYRLSSIRFAASLLFSVQTHKQAYIYLYTQTQTQTYIYI
ncbi:hypothetical protein DQ04_06071000 [Trypanosoma grayi]|uniref:hypothetical protein n=1 Tax=Trypanosoma grayi TaxID=71804 RepID=UPI0004F4A57D|nr:hypothetical protein DQ04_06071000 [Trypanosoma grayi]KEG08968.1 hypothetical protein DQ04_06071000 [Trypanosoma grayi]